MRLLKLEDVLRDSALQEQPIRASALRSVGNVPRIAKEILVEDVRVGTFFGNLALV